MAAAALMATSFHVVPMMAAESGAGSHVVQTAMLRATVPSSADIPLVASPACAHRLAKPAVAPAAPITARPVVALAGPRAARPAVAPVAAASDPKPAAAPVALPVPQSAPAVAPPPPVASPAPAAVAPAAPAAPAVAPVAPAAPADADKDKDKSKRKSSYVYRMTGPDGNEVVIINGKARALTPEEQQEIEKAMEQFKNGDFAKHMVDVQEQMAKLKVKDTFDSPEFGEKMESMQRELAQSAFVNNAELQARVQAMTKNFDIRNMNVGHCKDGVVKDKEKTKQKQKKSEDPQVH
jgi:hypothetical protein